MATSNLSFLQKEAFSPRPHPPSSFSPSEKLGFTFSGEFATFYLGEAATLLLPGKSHEQKSLVGCSPWGR